ARYRARIGNELCQRCSVLGTLAKRLVIENDARYIVSHRIRAEQHFAIITTHISGRCYSNRVKALLDRASTLVRCKDALARSHHPGCNVLKTFAHLLASPSLISFLPSRGQRQTE